MLATLATTLPCTPIPAFNVDNCLSPRPAQHELVRMNSSDFTVARRHHTISSRALGGKQSGIGRSHDLVPSRALGRIVGNAATNGNRTGHTWETVIFKMAAQFLRDRGRVFSAGFRQHDGELLAAEATDHIKLAQLLPKYGRNSAQNVIADQMTEVVVELFEVIDIDHDDGHAALKAAGAFQLFADAHLETAAVVNAGESVDVGKLLDALEIIGVLDGGRADVGHRLQGLNVFRHKGVS